MTSRKSREKNGAVNEESWGSEEFTISRYSGKVQ